MQQWEYATITLQVDEGGQLTEAMTQLLADWGKQGWELVAVPIYPGNPPMSAPRMIAFFKRPVDPER